MLINRIRSNAGATILIALLFFLICAVAGSIILAAGTSASGRISGLVEHEQSYYSVTSAAQLMKAEIENQEFDYSINESSEEYSYIKAPDSDISTLLKAGGEATFKANRSTTPIKDLTYEDTLTLKSSDSKLSAIKTVGGTFEVSSDYSIKVKLYALDDKGNKLKNSYRCTVKVPAVLAMNRKKITIYNNGSPYVREETKLIWTGAKIQKTE